MSKRAPYYAARPDVDYISIYCAEPSHADKPWLIASFVRQWYPELGDAGAWLWVESTSYWRDHRAAIRLKSGEHSGTTAQSLAGDQHVRADDFQQDLDIFERGNSRTRYRFECRTCGLSIVRKDPAVSEAFEKLRGVGVLEISLRALGPMMK